MCNPNLPSELIRFSADVNNSLSTLGVSICQKELRSPTDLHWHDYFEIEIITKGTALHHQHNEITKLAPGSLCFLTPIGFHQVEPLEPLEIMNITFSDSWIPSDFLTLFMNKQQSVVSLSPESFEYMKVVSDKLLEEFSRDGQYRMFYMKSLLNCILSEIAYYFPSVSESSAKNESNVIRHSLTYLYCNFRSNPSLHDAAQISGLCDNYFSEVFRKATGQTYNRFLNDLKLQYACDLLLHSDKSVTDICFLSGFNSMTHFQREFKKKYQCTPSEKKSADLTKSEKDAPTRIVLL